MGKVEVVSCPRAQYKLGWRRNNLLYHPPLRLLHLWPVLIYICLIYPTLKGVASHVMLLKPVNEFESALQIRAIHFLKTLSLNKSREKIHSPHQYSLACHVWQEFAKRLHKSSVLVFHHYFNFIFQQNGNQIMHRADLLQQKQQCSKINQTVFTFPSVSCVSCNYKPQKLLKAFHNVKECAYLVQYSQYVMQAKILMEP